MLVATGTTLIVQKLIRWLLTSPRMVLPDGTVLSGDYIFNTKFGVGLLRFIGDAPSGTQIDAVKNLIMQGVQAIDEIAPVPAPTVDVKKMTGGLRVTVAFTNAQNNRPYAVSFPLAYSS